MTTLKVVGGALYTHYQQFVTTKTRLLKLRARDGSVLGIAAHDVDIPYDDGAGEVIYSAPIGFGDVAIDKKANLEVDNTEAKVLLAKAGPFTSRAIEAGILDYGTFVIYQVNRESLSDGHEIVATGTIGIVKDMDGLAGVIELRGLPQQLKQNYIELDSLTCRAVFGSGGGATCIQSGQCGYDAESLWQEHEISAIGLEVDRTFTADATPTVAGDIPFVPGLIHWLTGDNAGLQSEVEEMDGPDIVLRFGTPWDMQLGDTFKIRPDCDKEWATCRDVFGNQLNFRGEPKIPVADERSQSVPSPSSSTGVLPESE